MTCVKRLQIRGRARDMNLEPTHSCMPTHMQSMRQTSRRTLIEGDREKWECVIRHSGYQTERGKQREGLTDSEDDLNSIQASG